MTTSVINAVFALLVIPMFMACDTAAQKDQRGMHENRTERNQPDQDKFDATEWKNYRATTESRIKANEDRIDELRKTQQDQTDDHMYSNRIDALESRNTEFRHRLDRYDRDRGDWATFKREFDQDMELFSRDLEGIGTYNGN